MPNKIYENRKLHVCYYGGKCSFHDKSLFKCTCLSVAFAAVVVASDAGVAAVVSPVTAEDVDVVVVVDTVGGVAASAAACVVAGDVVVVAAASCVDCCFSEIIVAFALSVPVSIKLSEK